ncbi:response regulator [Belnapia moabensis]|uniref:response regulator n=1 Tax=Belnapia moabensis TaxID=365533 RepID=UPI0009FD5796|nr:response regulator [Belnapia moabensis]
MATQKPRLGAPEAGAAHILIAEDEAMIALSLSDLLEAEGYEVSIAGDGVVALAEVERLGTRLDALVTDLNMPRMSGEDLIRALQGVQPDLPVIVVTGSAPPGGLPALQDGSGNGPCALLHKPIKYGDLVAAVRCAVLAKPSRHMACG